jgi:hypothetical protein
MLIPRKSKKPSHESRLAETADIAAQLPDEALVLLHEFAGFLAHKYPPEVVVITEIVPIPRPGKEGVIPAIKRLSKTYPMLDKKVLFEQTSAAMSAHVLKEISSEESIDRLEKVFRKEYDDLIERENKGSSG